MCLGVGTQLWESFSNFLKDGLILKMKKIYTEIFT